MNSNMNGDVNVNNKFEYEKNEKGIWLRIIGKVIGIWIWIRVIIL